MLPYEQLVVWKDAHALAVDCFRVSARWPDYWLQRQLRRASASVAANLIEGSSHLSNAEFARFDGLAAMLHRLRTSVRRGAARRG